MSIVDEILEIWNLALKHWYFWADVTYSVFGLSWLKLTVAPNKYHRRAKKVKLAQEKKTKSIMKFLPDKLVCMVRKKLRRKSNIIIQKGFYGWTLRKMLCINELLEIKDFD